jgi:hypothetical protein
VVGGKKGNGIGKNWETSGVIIPTICGTSFCGISVVYKTQNGHGKERELISIMIGRLVSSNCIVPWAKFKREQPQALNLIFHYLGYHRVS